jgi:hypothetical protein
VVGLGQALCQDMRGTASNTFSAFVSLLIINIAQDWLSKMISSKKEIWPHLAETYGEKDTATWYYRWQIFYMACAELFAYEGGDTWGVAHYLFEKPSPA